MDQMGRLDTVVAEWAAEARARLQAHLPALLPDHSVVS
jgi:hypothetical protein